MTAPEFYKVLFARNEIFGSSGKNGKVFKDFKRLIIKNIFKMAFWGLIFAGLVGAILAAPKQEEKQELEYYRNIKQQISARIEKIGNLEISRKLIPKPLLYNLFKEACNMFSYGSFRGASVFSVVVIENILREKYKEDNFKKLIEKAKNDNLIELNDKHYLDGLRVDRNNLIHDASRKINENESLFLIQLSIRIMNKIL